jgi:predicted acyltransferase
MGLTESIDPPATALLKQGRPARLASLDALRGFDMFWIIGTEGIVHSLAEITGWSIMAWGSVQLTHVAWDGFAFYDMIFPLFLFVAGAAMPFSLTHRRERGDGKSKLTWQLVRRAGILVLLGVFYSNLTLFYSKGPLWLSNHLDEVRFASVLGRIGVASLFAGLIVLNFSERGQVLWFFALLLGYWTAMMLIPVPGIGAGQLTRQGNLASWIDQHLLPGRLRAGRHDPVGLFTTIPAVGTTLLGVFSGTFLRRQHPNLSGTRKVLWLIAAGVVCLTAGWLWGQVFPINKNLWTSSFVLFAGGWSLLLLALFYGVIDVWGVRRWAIFFTVIGMNSILVYLIEPFISFGFPIDYCLKLFFTAPTPPVRGLIKGIVVVGMEWLFLLLLYRKKLFLKV